jgi:Protein of unknown function (DUF2937)
MAFAAPMGQNQGRGELSPSRGVGFMGRFLAFLLGIAGALIGAQAPGFTLQYMQSLQGRVDELTTMVAAYDADMAANGYTREAALSECRTSEDLLKAMCGGYDASVERLDALHQHLAMLEAASDYVRPLLVARHLDRTIATSVYKQFEPAVPATVHGAVYAGGGFAVLWGAASFLFGIIGAMFGGGRRYA